MLYSFNKTALFGLFRLDTDIPVLLKPGAIRVLDRAWGNVPSSLLQLIEAVLFFCYLV
jgi:hypothetical protein